jgi:hypothetical protein
MAEITDIVIPNLTDTQKVNIEVLKNITSINTALNDAQHDIKDLQNSQLHLEQVLLTGNGELPLRETVRNHTAFINGFNYWLKIIIGLFLAQFIAFTTASVIAYIKFLPVLEALSKKP